MPLRKPSTNGSSFSTNLETYVYTLKFTISQLKLLIFLVLASICITPLFAAVPTIVIHWSTVTSNGDPDLLKDRNGNPLSIGSGGNGSGYIATLGYFDEANNSALENHFLGSWVPLTSGTRVGDSSTGYGFSDGMFSFTTVFTKASNLVTVFPFEPASYQVQTPFPITASAPPSGTPICIRFYDATTISPASRYNTVTGPDWKWPAFSGGIPENLYLKISSGTAFPGSDWKYGNYFEDPDNNFTTSLELQSYLTVNVIGSGSVGNLDPSYNYGSIVPITATPNTNMEFVEWRGSGVDQPTFAQTTVLMDTDRNITAVFEPKDFNVVINENGKGSTTGSGLHPFGSTINITATADFGYAFSHWEGAGPDSNTSSNTTLTIQQDHSLIAHFNPLPFTINISAGTGGVASSVESGTPPFYFDNNYTLFADPNFGYSFSHWSSPSNSLSLIDSQINPITSFLVQGDASYTANFSQIKYDLKVLMGEGGQAVYPESGDQSALSMVQVTAVAQEGFDFKVWEDPDALLTDTSLSVTEANMSKASGSVSVTATFSKKTYSVEINEGSGGNVSLSPASGPWEHNGVYELNATAQVGYTFSEWQGDANSTSSLLNGTNDAINKIGVSSPISLTAIFAENAYSISATTTQGGTVSGTNSYSIHDTPTITATPSAGWQFSHWIGDLDYLVAPNSTSSLVNLSLAPLTLSYEAVFVREIYDFTVIIDGNGSVNGNSSNFTLSPDSASQVSLTAVSQAGWDFERWYGYAVSDSASSSITFIPTSSGSLTATFKRNSYDLTVTSSTGGETNGTGSYLYDSAISLQASPSPGYKFVKWTGNTELIDELNPMVTLRIPNQNISLHAEFNPIPLTITTSVVGSGSVSSGGTYDTGSTVTLSATPSGVDAAGPRGYQLERWIWFSSGGSSYNSTDNPLELFMDSNFTVTAVFSAIPPSEVEIDLVSTPSGGGTLFDDPDARTWDVNLDLIQRDLHASANPGFSFLGWNSNLSVSFNPSWMNPVVTATPQSASTITAYFSPITQKVLTSFDSSRGTVTGAGTDLSTNTSRVITAQPGENQIFYSWELNKTIDYIVSRENSSVTTDETRLFIDGKESPVLNLVRGFTYRFLSQLPANENLFLGLNKNDSQSSAYENGVTDTQNSDGFLTFTVPTDAPDQLYYCSSQQSYSGNNINIISKTDEEILPFPNESQIEPVLDFDLALHATFIGKEIKATIIEPVGGSIAGITDGQTFSYMDSVNISAVPNEHYLFDRWELSQAISSSTEDSSLQFDIMDSLTIRAFFKPKSYSLTLLSSPSHAGNAFTTDNVYSYPYGSIVPIQVIPLPGNRFEYWSGNVADTNSLQTSVTIEGNTTVVAQFSETLIDITKQTLALDPNGNSISDDAGTITGGESFALGAIARFTAYPNEGFEFKRWEDENGKILSSSSSSNIQISGFTNLIAVFQKQLHEVQVISTPSGKGEVQWTGRGTGEILTGRVIHGDSISLQATPVAGYLFEKWTSSSGDLYQSGQELLELAVTKPMIINARFVPINPVELTISVSPENSGWTFGQGIVNQNAKYPILAKPNPGYLFDRWDGADILDSSAANTSLDLNQDKELIAYFKTDPNFNSDEFPLIDQLGIFNLKVTTADILKGSVSGSGVFGTGWAEIKAFPQQGFNFVQWNSTDVEDQYALNTFIFLSKDTEIEAIFEPVPVIAGSQKISSNWWQSDWFGTYWNVNGSWLYHKTLGWLHIPTSQQNELETTWVWIDKLDSWCWTGKEMFPHLFHDQLNGWVWIDLNQSSPAQMVLFQFDMDGMNGSWLIK
ncbi:MAG: hypothetical protein VXZ37_00515 [Verrucomicrobiota bacterium]|nr:hypothetical protein [Verrucomicrobiota bacterium]